MKNPAESAAQIEEAIFQKANGISSSNQYASMARKVIDHIRKTDVVIEGGNDVIELVNAALSHRTPAM